uniref:Uncharacterized protein n=1 Tax=Triticum urartu TaxID=4572 RepID=A0A8R7TWA0_TRIUA
HLPLHGPILYILLHLLLVRVINVIAHLRDRALFIHLITSPSEFTIDLYEEDTPSGFKTPHGKTPQDLLTKKNYHLLYHPLLRSDLVSLFMFMDLAY